MGTLCVDFGSTFIKFFVLENDKIIFFEKTEFPKPCIANGIRYEVSLGSINDAVYGIFKKTENFKINKFFCCVQMHGYILRTESGTFSNYVSWRDKSGDITLESVKNIDFSKNGTSLKSNLPAVKLTGCPPAEKSIFFTLGSYIAYLLTGKNTTHKTDGCASGFFASETLKPAITVKNLILPEVTDGVLQIGEYNGAAVFSPLGDHQTSFLGSGAGNSAYLLNIGTATQISTVDDKEFRLPEFNGNAVFERRPYFGGKYLLTVSGLTGGQKLSEETAKAEFTEEILSVLKILPHKRRVLLGGGGAEAVFEPLKKKLKNYDIECYLLNENIGARGLKMISNAKKALSGTMLSEVCFPNFPVILKNNNIDFMIIDNEHGAFDYAFLSSVITVSRLVGLSVIMRLPDNNRKDITKLVDMGAEGFLLPMTDTPEQIKRVVDFAKYAPVGHRGISTNRAHTLYNPPPIKKYMISANERVKIYAQIETADGVNNIDGILGVNGVEGVFAGPNDLSCSLGCIGNSEPVKAALEKISAAAKRHNKTWGIITTSRELIDCAVENSVDLISYGSEINMLNDSCRNLKKNIYGL